MQIRHIYMQTLYLERIKQHSVTSCIKEGRIHQIHTLPWTQGVGNNILIISCLQGQVHHIDIRLLAQTDDQSHCSHCNSLGDYQPPLGFGHRCQGPLVDRRGQGLLLCPCSINGLRIKSVERGRTVASVRFSPIYTSTPHLQQRSYRTPCNCCCADDGLPVLVFKLLCSFHSHTPLSSPVYLSLFARIFELF